MKKLLFFLVLLPLLLITGFVLWALTPPAPLEEAQRALASNPWVEIQTQPWITFSPLEHPKTTGLILYPGGRIDPRAYAPAAAAIASSGYLVVIVPMPLNLAVLDPQAGAEVIAGHPEIENWAIGGHSLGGAMAASFAHAHPEQVDGLVLWAAYPARKDDLSQNQLEVVSIFASLDGLADLKQIQASQSLLPKSTEWIEIEGGNHSQFGWYGNQWGDNPAAISRSEQQREVIQTTLDLLARIDKE